LLFQKNTQLPEGGWVLTLVGDTIMEWIEILYKGDCLTSARQGEINPKQALEKPVLNTGNFPYLQGERPIIYL